MLICIIIDLNLFFLSIVFLSVLVNEMEMEEKEEIKEIRELLTFPMFRISEHFSLCHFVSKVISTTTACVASSD